MSLEENIGNSTDINPFVNLTAELQQRMLFSLLYLASRPVFYDEIAPIFKAETKEEFEEKIVPVINRINDELSSRLAPYKIFIDSINHKVELSLEKETLEKITFSAYIFREYQRNLSRDKIKVLVFIAYKTIIRHSEITIEDIISKLGVNSVAVINELEKDGLVFQNKVDRKDKIVRFELSNLFYELFGFPQEPFELSRILREQLISFLEEEEVEEFE
jgi:chromosome segregation and condensation protein ScpB